MNPPPNECAAGSLCQGAGKTLGNHYCCRCKKTVHSVFCSKEVDSLEGNIKESFKDDEQKGSFKEVCNLCVEKATNQLSMLLPLLPLMLRTMRLSMLPSMLLLTQLPRLLLLLMQLPRLLLLLLMLELPLGTRLTK